MALNRQEYNSEISLYYQEELPYELAEAISRHVWLGLSSAAEAENFELIRDIRSKVYRMKFQGEVYYLKSYTPRDTSKIIKNFFRPADAVRYFQVAAKLSAAGVPIAQPVLALTKKTGFRSADSIFVTREVPGKDLYAYLLQGAQDDPEQRKKMVNQFAFMWSRLINLNLVHQDPWLGNFIIHFGEEKNDFQIALIDVDNIYFIPLLPRKLFWLLNVKRLHYKLGRVNFAVSQSEINVFLEQLNKFMKMETR